MQLLYFLFSALFVQSVHLVLLLLLELQLLFQVVDVGLGLLKLFNHLLLVNQFLLKLTLHEGLRLQEFI